MTPGDLPLLSGEWADVRESEDPGAYYCAHVMWVGARAAERAGHLLNDDEGDPMRGFLHVPPDPWTVGGDTSPNVSLVGRHVNTANIVAATLRGWADVAPAREPLRVLLTGFGKFRDVTDNPTGAFVRDAKMLRYAAALAFPGVPTEVEERDGGVDLAVLNHAAIQTEMLNVDDSCLDVGHARSVPALLERTRAQAWLALGVGRSAHYRVEVRPTNAGLDEQGERPRHEAGRAETRGGPWNRSLARAIVRGAAAIDAQPAPLASA